MSKYLDDGRRIGTITGFGTDGRIVGINHTSSLEVDGIKLPWHETPDFPLTDPWSTHTRNVISTVRGTGGFKGNFFEAGIGDARNALIAGAGKNGGTITGVDLDGWRLDFARTNLANAGVPTDRIVLNSGDVVSYLHGLSPEDKLSGWGVACLPQAPGFETHNHADGFDPDMPSLSGIKDLTLAGHSVDDVGLTLNGGFLAALRDRVTVDFNLLLTMSDRVPPEIRELLFGKTGWYIAGEHRTKKPIQQDPDTGVAFVVPFDDGRRFYEKITEDVYIPMPAEEVEKRRFASEQNGGRESLNAYHHLSVYHLKPGATVVYET